MGELHQRYREKYVHSPTHKQEKNYEMMKETYDNELKGKLIIKLFIFWIFKPEN